MYKWNAEDYQNSFNEQQKWVREFIVKLELKGDERVIDIGCGDGMITAEIVSYLMVVFRYWQFSGDDWTIPKKVSK